MERVGRIVGDGLPGRMGVPSLLEGNDGRVVISAQCSNGGPVCLEARDVKIDQVNGGPRAVAVRGAGIGPSSGVEA